MAWMTTLLAGTGGKIAAVLAAGAVLVVIGWLLIRVGVKRGLAMARESDAVLRAEAEKASGGGYAHAKDELEGVDPVGGGPLDGGVRRPGDPGRGAA